MQHYLGFAFSKCLRYMQEMQEMLVSNFISIIKSNIISYSLCQISLKLKH